MKKYNITKNKNIIILSGKWITFKEQNQKKITIKENDNSLNKIKVIKKEERCSSLFTSINVAPNHNVLSCCGLTLKNNKYLILGNAKKNPLNVLYEHQFDDFLKIWLFTEGPRSILDFCMLNRNKQTINTSEWHLCQICAEIFRDSENIHILQEKYKSIMANVILKYAILQTQYVKSLNI